MARILIIDDEASVRSCVRCQLEEAGHSVVEAARGKQGIDICEHERVDLVICDVLLPDIDGLDAIMALLRMPSNTPVIAISGLSNIVWPGRKLAQSVGVASTLTKPFGTRQLLTAVNAALAARRGKGGPSNEAVP